MRAFRAPAADDSWAGLRLRYPPPHEVADAASPVPACPSYTPLPAHRNCTRLKSQWDISEDEETSCFHHAWRRNWLEDSVGWGLHLDDSGKPSWLGHSFDNQCPLWFAKFVGVRELWHGYPADLKRRGRADAPNARVAFDWWRRGHIRKATFSKLRQGKKCVP